MLGLVQIGEEAGRRGAGLGLGATWPTWARCGRPGRAAPPLDPDQGGGGRARAPAAGRGPARPGAGGEAGNGRIGPPGTGSGRWRGGDADGSKRRRWWFPAGKRGERGEREGGRREGRGRCGNGDLGRRLWRSSPARRRGWSPATRRRGGEALRHGICSGGARACGRAGRGGWAAPGPDGLRRVPIWVPRASCGLRRLEGWLGRVAPCHWP